MSQNSENIVNEYVKGITFNAQVMIDAINLGPLPQMIREPSHHAYADQELICDASFQDFRMPFPCNKCYSFSCNEICSKDKPDEEMELPHPEPMRRMYTNAHLPPDEPDDEEMELPPPEPIRRMYTNSHLPPDEPDHKLLIALSEAESNMLDEYQEAFFKELEDKKQEQEQEQDKDQDK